MGSEMCIRDSVVMVPGIPGTPASSDELQAFLGMRHGSMHLINGSWCWQDRAANDNRSYDVYLNNRAYVYDDILFDESNVNKNCRPLPVQVRNQMLRSLLEPEILATGRKHVQSALNFLVSEETRKQDHRKEVMSVTVANAGTPKASWRTTGWNLSLIHI